MSTIYLPFSMKCDNSPNFCNFPGRENSQIEHSGQHLQDGENTLPLGEGIYCGVLPCSRCHCEGIENARGNLGYIL